MSEMINNREYRQKILKELIKELHNGKSVEEIKPRFEELIQGISTKEITDMEQALIMEGMPVAEIQNLCDVHAAVFKGSIEEIHRPEKPEEIEGHPVHTFQLENRRIEEFIDVQVSKHIEEWSKTTGKGANMSAHREQIKKDFQTLFEIDRHYSRKENLLFPYLEQYGITAPPKVMWGVDDEIREEIKEVSKLLQAFDGINELNENGINEDGLTVDGINEDGLTVDRFIEDGMNKTGIIDKNEIIEKAEAVIHRIKEMIFKEEHILFPMAIDTLTEEEWGHIARESEEIGFTFTKPKVQWKPSKSSSIDVNVMKQEFETSQDNEIKFDAGHLSPEEANAMMNTLPLDITFVDKEGKVKYFTQGKERIFARPKTVIGRDVSNCHPPASVHIVEQIVEDLKTGKKDHEDFWIKMKDQFVYIRYYAVRNESGDFLGIMEVTQNIKPIQELTGEKRLVSEE